LTRQLFEHTADIRLRVEASTLADLFREAMLGMFEIMRAQPADDAAPVRSRIEIRSADQTALLVDFLNEALSRAHIGRECFERAEFERLTEREVVADLVGRAPARFEQDVKAVTYHEAEVRQEGGVWSTTLVFDI
jgi:SHS2 domain-containing protein